MLWLCSNSAMHVMTINFTEQKFESAYVRLTTLKFFFSISILYLQIVGIQIKHLQRLLFNLCYIYN